MTRLLVVVENSADWASYYPSVSVVSARDYLRSVPVRGEGERVHVINLCRSYRYLGTGYYVSLLAEARGHGVLPSVRTLSALRRRALYGLDIEDLNARLDRLLPADSRDTTDFGIVVHFGQTAWPGLQDLAQQVFEIFPCPLLRIRFERQRLWQIRSIRPIGLQTLDGEQEDAFAAALEQFSRKVWRRPRQRRAARHDLAMLVNPEEAMPPSNRRALKAFVAAGRALDIEVDLIGRRDFPRLAEYDALFIRETTSSDDHTYRFAHRAEREGLAVIDDPVSILRCTNKIFLKDLLGAHRIAIPRTEVLYRADPRGMDAAGERLGFPLVLKIPDGSFSRGVLRVAGADELRAAAERLFQHSALLLAQEYVPTAFDWRIGVLAGEPLYACKYLMSRGHWQIYDHQHKGAPRSGGFEAVTVDAVPAAVLKAALRAARLIGNGLYGVDLKEVDGRVLVIEVNDNPSIDAGVEDACAGAEVYRHIMAELLRRIETRGTRRG